MTKTQDWSAEPAIEWLLEEGRHQADIAQTLACVGERLIEAGAPIWRLRLSMRTLHPMITAYSAIWERGASSPRSLNAPHGLESRPAYKGSPLEMIGKTGEPFRKKLTEQLGPDEHSVLHEMKARGATDYYGVPLHFSDNLGGILIMVSDQPAGFSDADIAKLHRVALMLAPFGELSNTRLTARAVADAYLGPRSGKLVLEGRITRGHIEKINAAIMVSDIRDWTGISNHQKPEDALELVNQYFDVISECVEANGGEILKFLGDGIMAVFPVGQSDMTPSKACERALAAAQQTLLRSIQTEKVGVVETGFGLHFGEVLYGNVGSATRLDFTVLGPAVNRTARIEGLCSRLQIPILFSTEFRDQISVPVQTVTTMPLKGFEGVYEIFTLAD